jgi:hypothetical protein
MAFTGNFMCTSFKQEILQGVHNFTASTGNTFKLALYTDSASFTAATTAYTVTNEVGNSGTYAAGGGTLTNITPTTSGTTAFTDFDDLSFTTATITARGALIYNDTAAGDPFGCGAGLWLGQDLDRWHVYDPVPDCGCQQRHN